MRQFFWKTFQLSITYGFYLLWYFSNGFDAGLDSSSPGAALVLGLFVAMLATGIIVRTTDWIRRHRLPPHLREPDDVPGGIPYWRKPAWRLQNRIAGSVEFRRAVEGIERQVDG